MGHLLAFHEVDQERLQPSQPPGRLEQLAAQVGRIAAGGEAGPVKRIHAPCEVLHHARSANRRKREPFQDGRHVSVPFVLLPDAARRSTAIRRLRANHS